MPHKDRQTVQIGPWRRLASECRYQNPWIAVHHDDVITPAGTRGIYGRIHFKNRAIGIVPLDDDGNTWLVGQYRYALDAWSWEIPMGGGPFDKTPLEAAQAELREEAGLLADNWRMIQTLHTSNSVTDEIGHVFVATSLRQVQADPEPTEDISIRKLALSEAVEWAMDGRITDAISVAALLKVSLMRQSSR